MDKRSGDLQPRSCPYKWNLKCCARLVFGLTILFFLVYLAMHSITVPTMETSCWLGKETMSIGGPITANRVGVGIY